MSESNQPFSDIVQLNPRFLRSVNLDRDFYTQDAATDYIVTRGTRAALSLLARGLRDASYRAQCISGPYGSGKSALALYFAKILDHQCPKAIRQQARRSVDDWMRNTIPKRAKEGYVTIVATGTREPLASCLMRGVKNSLRKAGLDTLLDKLPESCRPALTNDGPQTPAVVNVCEELSRIVTEEQHGIGIVLVIDELGKLLEYASSNPDDGDIQLLQNLAEAASRSDEHPLWLITILHQHFAQYAVRLGTRYQQEWAKVQARFFDVPHTLDSIDSLQLIASALNGSLSAAVANNQLVKNQISACKEYAPRGAEQEFIELCLASYPLHPSTLLLLLPLFRKFGQNERSLFSFLTAYEPHSLPLWMEGRRYQESNPPFVRLPDLFDYLHRTLIGVGLAPALIRDWTETEDILGRLGESTECEIHVLKSIALLALLGESSGQSATESFLTKSLCSATHDEQSISVALQKLMDKRLIVFRRFRNAYRLWEGSDIDIADRLTEAYQKIPLQANALRVAKELCPSMPIMARKHSFRTGMVRYFEFIPCTLSDFATTVHSTVQGHGKVIQCLLQTREEQDQVEVIVANPSFQLSSVIVLTGIESESLLESSRDVASLDWVDRNTPGLVGDRIARRELNERMVEAHHAFLSAWNRSFDPTSASTACYYLGKRFTVRSHREFMSLLSEACDRTYPYAPMVNNELINRRNLSSAASAARGALMEAMLAFGDRQGLGIQGYPPERSIYESILLASGIHGPDESGSWRFGVPNMDSGLKKAWEYIIGSATSDDMKPRPLSDIFNQLAGPPYGVAEGFLPVLLCACLLANSTSLALYEEGLFIPELSNPVMERLTRRPERFSLVSHPTEGEHSQVIQRLAKGFQVSPELIPVVRALYARITSLPPYAKNVRCMSRQTLDVRDAILLARRPEKLIFHDLPTAVGCSSFANSKADIVSNGKLETFFQGLNAAFAELRDCYPELISAIKHGCFMVFDLYPDQQNWMEVVSTRAGTMQGLATDTRLRKVLTVVQRPFSKETDFLESFGAAVTDQHPTNWNQLDQETFTSTIPRLASDVRTLEAIQPLRSSLTDAEGGCLISLITVDGREFRRLSRYTAEHGRQIVDLADRIIEALPDDIRISYSAIAQVLQRLADREQETHG